MKITSRRWLFVLGLFSGVAGCGDGPEQILRDRKNVMNESADVLSQVTDDATGLWAKEVAKKLKDKFTDLKDREDKYNKAADEAQKASFALMLKGKQFLEDIAHADRRLASEVARVRQIPFSDSEVKTAVTGLQDQAKQSSQPGYFNPSAKKAKTHTCPSCNKETGEGGDGPLLTFCPNCGARLRGIAPGIIAAVGGTVFALGWLVVFLIKKQSAE
jgi:hypothetical protein